jgi:hypothetical protein
MNVKAQILRNFWNFKFGFDLSLTHFQFVTSCEL